MWKTYKKTVYRKNNTIQQEKERYPNRLADPWCPSLKETEAGTGWVKCFRRRPPLRRLGKETSKLQKRSKMPRLRWRKKKNSKLKRREEKRADSFSRKVD